MSNGAQAIKAIPRDEVKTICETLNKLNPYDSNIIPDILKVEDCNYDESNNLHSLYARAISAKRCVFYQRQKSILRIIKPSEDGLGIVYTSDERKRYKLMGCKDQENQYPVWIVESWDRLFG